MRLLLLGLADRGSPLSMLNDDTGRHVIYAYLRRMGLSLRAIHSRRAPWATMLRPAITWRRRVSAAPPAEAPREASADAPREVEGRIRWVSFFAY